MGASAAVVVLALGLTLPLTGCGSDGDSDGGSTELSATEHNDADVAFASEMIQHHAQALSMVDLTIGRDLDPAVQALADDIRAAQTPEIETMSDWLAEWGEDIPETVRDHANAGHGTDGSEGMDHGDGHGADDPGTMSADDMVALAEAADADFQELWLELMVEHHEGAVEMAEEEQVEGRYEPAVELAKEIQESQTAEIDTMAGLLS
jgi:uncharacterized protein (DUF305 family)